MKHRLSWAVALSIVVALASVGVAAADVVHNDIDDSITDEAEVLVLAPGDEVEVVVAINSDNDLDDYPDANGCNVRNQGGVQRQLIVDIANSNPAAATLSASQLTFDGCDDFHTLTVTAVAAGTAEIRFSINAASTALDHTYVAPADFDVQVVSDDPGREATSIANEFLRSVADADLIEACTAANGTNRNNANWHGKLISKVSAEFGDQTFTSGQEQVVIDYVLDLCS